MQSASNDSAHFSGSSHGSGVGHAGGVVKPDVHIEHFPQLLHSTVEKIF
jgi:hypothetical protein